MTSTYKQKELTVNVPQGEQFKHYPVSIDRRFTREDLTPSSDTVIETPKGKVLAKKDVPVCIMTDVNDSSKKWVCKGDSFDSNFEEVV